MYKIKIILITNIINFLSHIHFKNKIKIYILTFLMLISSFFEVMSIGALLPFLGVLINPEIVYESQYLRSLVTFLRLGSKEELILPLTLIFIFLAIFSGIFRIIVVWSLNIVSYKIGAELAENIFKKTLYQPYSVHINRNTSSVISIIITKVDQAISGVFIPVLTIINALMMFISIMLALIIIEPKSTLMSVFVIIMLYLIIWLFIKNYLNKISQTISNNQNELVKNIQESLGGIKEIIISGSQKFFVDNFKKIIYPLRNSQAYLQIFSSTPKFIIETISITIFALLSFYLITKDQNIAYTIPVLGAIAMSAQRLLPHIQSVFSSLTAIKSFSDSLIDVNELLNQKIINAIGENNKNLITFNKSIELKKVYFSYKNDVNWVLNNLNLKVTKGQKIGIIGETGGGKTTLVDVLLGLIKVSNGKFLVDGKEINNSNVMMWQNRVSYVPQNIFLYDKSFKENIAFGIPTDKIDLKKIEKASKMSEIATTIKKIKNNYNAQVGERGSFLSGGQLQRIGIARAFYKNSDILIFDEATSALDLKTEKEILNTIESLGKNSTVIYVTHRKESLKFCDIIFELKNGNLNKVKL